MAYEILQETALEYYGIKPTKEKTEQFGESDEDFSPYKTGTGYSIDSADRDLLGDLIVQDVLGPGRHWPVHGEGIRAFSYFKQEFALAAREKGYTLEGPLWPDLAASVVLLIEDIKEQGDLIRKLADRLEDTLRKVLATKYQVGSIIDVSKPGLGNRARVVMGRGYGQKFRVESNKYSVFIDTDDPVVSTWRLHAISVKDDGSVLGKQVSLQGKFFHPPMTLKPDQEVAFIAKVIKDMEVEF